MNQSTNKKLIRPVEFSNDEFEIFDFDFRILCALKKQNISERFAELMQEDMKKNKHLFSETWVTQNQLIDELEKANLTVTRQTLRTHRRNGLLPLDHFIESKLSEADQAAKNQKTWYKLEKCLKFYQENN